MFLRSAALKLILQSNNCNFACVSSICPARLLPARSQFSGTCGVLRATQRHHASRQCAAGLAAPPSFRVDDIKHDALRQPSARRRSLTCVCSPSAPAAEGQSATAAARQRSNPCICDGCSPLRLVTWPGPPCRSAPCCWPRRPAGRGSGRREFRAPPGWRP